jgi:hypothetical protein
MSGARRFLAQFSLSHSENSGATHPDRNARLNGTVFSAMSFVTTSLRTARIALLLLNVAVLAKPQVQIPQVSRRPATSIDDSPPDLSKWSSILDRLAIDARNRWRNST